MLGGALIVPVGLLRNLQCLPADKPPAFSLETERGERLAMQAVMDAERKLGFDLRDVSAENLGHDIESRIPGTGRLRSIEAKGRVKGATTVTITRNETLTGLNKPDDFILAIGLIDGDSASVNLHSVHRPFVREPDIGATSVNYELATLLALSQEPG